MPVLSMFSRSVNDTVIVVSVRIIGDATTLSVTYDRHSDDSRCVIYDRKIFYNTSHRFESLSKVLITPEACIINLITAVIYDFRNKLECLSLASLFSLV